MWKLGMNVTAGKFLFLGDYVDRGMQGLECLAYLFSLKVRAGLTGAACMLACLLAFCWPVWFACLCLPACLLICLVACWLAN